MDGWKERGRGRRVRARDEEPGWEGAGWGGEGGQDKVKRGFHYASSIYQDFQQFQKIIIGKSLLCSLLVHNHTLPNFPESSREHPHRIGELPPPRTQRMHITL